MARRLYTRFFATARWGPTTTPLNFVQLTITGVTVVLRTITMVSESGTGRAWLQLHGPVPPHSTTGEILVAGNTLFTTPTHGPSSTFVYNVHIPLPLGSRIELHAPTGRWSVVLGGWALTWATSTTDATRHPTP